MPAEGAAIVAPNHKSFWDSFFIAVCTRRHLRFMAKNELIQARYGRLLVRLGAFPVRRGESDEDALETARTILRQGGLLALFPEGTRIRDPDQLRTPQARRRPPGPRGGGADRAGRDHGHGQALPRAGAKAAPRAGGIRPADRGGRARGDAGGRGRGGGGPGLAGGGASSTSCAPGPRSSPRCSRVSASAAA